MSLVKLYSEDFTLKESKWIRFFKFKRVLAFLVAIAILITAIGIGPVIGRIRQMISQKQASAPTTTAPTEKLSEKEKMERAVENLTKKLETNKTDPKLYTQRAALYYNLEQYDLAIDDYSSALALKNDPQTHYFRAIVYTVTEQNEEAYSDLLSALWKDPDNKDYLSLMADTSNALKRYSRALICLTALIAQEPENPTLYTLAGDACVYLGKFEESVAHYQNALTYHTETTEKDGISKAALYSAYANSLKSVEKFTEAAEAYTQSLQLKEDKALYFQRGFCLLQSQEYEKAIEDFSKCVELDYEVTVSKFQRGLCYYSIQNYEAAIEDFAAYEQANPDKNDSYLYMGLCYHALEQYDTARNYYIKCIEADISAGDCYFNLGNCYFNEENYSQAVVQYTEAIARNAQLYPALLNRGVAYIKLNKYNEAKVDLKRVIDECTDEALVKNAKDSYEPIKNITIITKK